MDGRRRVLRTGEQISLVAVDSHDRQWWIGKRSKGNKVASHYTIQFLHRV